MRAGRSETSSRQSSQPSVLIARPHFPFLGEGNSQSLPLAAHGGLGRRLSFSMPPGKTGEESRSLQLFLEMCREVSEMSEPIIDLRSDTVTRPSPAMRRAIADAVVGDDVYHEDPTVNRLEQKIAETLGKEAAVFVPSGTMSNQIAIRTHCQPGDELLCEASGHIYLYEQGAPAQLSGVVCHVLPGDFGLLDLEDFEGTINRKTSTWFAHGSFAWRIRTIEAVAGFFPLKE